MTCVVVEEILYNNDVGRKVRCMIESSVMPKELPTTGKDVIGLRNDDSFLPHSLLHVTSTGDYYLTNEEGVFIKQ